MEPLALDEDLMAGGVWQVIRWALFTNQPADVDSLLSDLHHAILWRRSSMPAKVPLALLD